MGTQPAVDAGLVEDMRAGRQLADLLASSESLQTDSALAHLLAAPHVLNTLCCHKSIQCHVLSIGKMFLLFHEPAHLNADVGQDAEFTLADISTQYRGS